MKTKKARDKPSALRRGIERAARRWGADLLLVAGAVMVSVGAALIYAPAGWLAGGALTIVGGVLAARGESGGDSG